MNTKECNRCNVEKELTEFYVYKPKNRKPYPWAHCKECHLKTYRDSEDKVQQRRVNRTASKDAAVAKVQAIKAETPCADCENFYPPYVMDFDHVRGVKVKNIAQMVGRNKWADIEAEIAKCEVVCSNCHRIRTHERRDFKGHTNHAGLV